MKSKGMVLLLLAGLLVLGGRSSPRGLRRPSCNPRDFPHFIFYRYCY